MFIVSLNVAFSPDNSKLYTNEFLDVFQYDLNVWNADSIVASQYHVYSKTDVVYLRLYNDTIYLAERNVPYLSTINNPNGAGITCGYQANTIPLFSGTLSSGTLPTEVVYPLYDTLALSALDSLICSDYKDGIKLVPRIVNAGYDYTWNNAATDTIQEVFAEGTYWVRYGDDCHTFIDTFILRGSGLEKPTITVDSNQLSTHQAYYSYQWMLNGQLISGATNHRYEVDENGNYQVIVTNMDGCVDTSDIYEVTNANNIRIHKMAGQIEVYPNPVQQVLRTKSKIPLNLSVTDIDGRMLVDRKNVKQIDLSALSEGMYLLYIYDSEGRLLKVEKIIRWN